MRALIADDHLLFRNLLHKALTAREVNAIDVAPDGAAGHLAIEESIAHRTPYQLVFLDWHMPDMSGLALLRLIRAERTYDASPVFMLSAEQEQANIFRHCGPAPPAISSSRSLPVILTGGSVTPCSMLRTVFVMRGPKRPDGTGEL